MKRALRLVITAGPTREYIDPVRFISNASTGAIGYELARQAQRRGHKVTLLSGPTWLRPPAGCAVYYFVSAGQLQRLCATHAANCDAVIAAAAVGDYRPQRRQRKKIKKTAAALSLRLVKNPDILAGLGRRKRGRVLVGFALETEAARAAAWEKLQRKHLDLIVANRLSGRLNPFGAGMTNAVLIDRDGTAEAFASIAKSRLARLILDRTEQLCYSFTTKKFPRFCKCNTVK